MCSIIVAREGDRFLKPLRLKVLEIKKHKNEHHKLFISIKNPIILIYSYPLIAIAKGGIFLFF
jgi:hypothetical protein